MTEVPKATGVESLTFALLYSLPEFARGIVVPRPSVTRLLARLGTQAADELVQRVDQVVAEELDGVLGRRPAMVDWKRLRGGYDRAVLRLVLGDSARDDVQILTALNALRRQGNWLGLGPRRRESVRGLRPAIPSTTNGHGPRRARPAASGSTCVPACTSPCACGRSWPRCPASSPSPPPGTEPRSPPAPTS
ncbi:hypothetical protein [Nonomuraea rubra]|uniref:Uncharacterized protein n=1 Tax=Nonomuraea rubra TaxID=46180 RepID=A0A7X0P610_9ACTN|nr:hypothetical protein [Nonomuraea rubra]MBB6555905.1 hypothetical protein [Nonomuraea rubra]